jgi:hypothetical protein
MTDEEKARQGMASQSSGSEAYVLYVDRPDERRHFLAGF